MLGVLWLAIWVVWGYEFAVSGWSTVADKIAAPAGVVTAPTAGEEMYAAYCVGCHGEDGLGYGRYSGDCSVPPRDLTQLARKNHGIYPVEKVWTILRQGTGQAPAERGYMPIWEPLLKVLNGDAPGVTEVRIRSLAEYVRTLQDRSMVAGSECWELRGGCAAGCWKIRENLHANSAFESRGWELEYAVAESLAAAKAAGQLAASRHGLKPCPDEYGRVVAKKI
jgi:mono/diheme cytochrome c family protein